MPILYENLKSNREVLALTRSLAPGRYEDALAEADRIEKEQNIKMSVDGLEPSHLGWSNYTLPIGTFTFSLKSNCRIYPVGIFSTDACFSNIKWYEGAFTHYLCDWLTKWVAELETKQQTMYPQPEFKGTFSFEIVSECPEKTEFSAWIVGYVVLPTTLRDMPVVA